MKRVRNMASETPDGSITTIGRRRLNRNQFALPPGPEEKRRGIKGRYPINERDRAQAALGYSTRFATPQERGKVIEAIHERYPDMEIKEITPKGNVRVALGGGIIMKDNRGPEQIIIDGKKYERAGTLPVPKRGLGTAKGWAKYQAENNNLDVKILDVPNGYELYVRPIEGGDLYNQGNVRIRNITDDNGARKIHGGRGRPIKLALGRTGNQINIGAGLVRERRTGRRHIRI